MSYYAGTLRFAPRRPAQRSTHFEGEACEAALSRPRDRVLLVQPDVLVTTLSYCEDAEILYLGCYRFNGDHHGMAANCRLDAPEQQVIRPATSRARHNQSADYQTKFFTPHRFPPTSPCTR